MTSGTFRTVSIEAIIVRPDRQRRDLGDVSSLASSIARRGLIHPLVLTRNYILVAGERRLTACRALGWDQIPIQFTDEVGITALEALELEENIKRQDISWQDRTAAIERWHKIALSEDPTWTLDKTAEELGITKQSVWQNLEVAEAVKVRPELLKEDKFSKVRGVVQRATSRAADAEASSIGYGSSTGLTDHTEGIICADFTEWAKTYSGPRFNLIHCDFPYGINSDKFGQGATQIGVYNDAPEVYDNLISTFLASLHNFCSDSAHLIFWFPMQQYEYTLRRLKEDFTVDPYPLIWVKSCGTGILPDPNRGYRRVYETAFFGSRGDRKVVRPKSNAVYLSTEKGAIHPHQKPVAVLEQFFGALIDDHTRLLDPTCGSGTAIRAAENLGANFTLGLERDGDFCRRAQQEFKRSREAY